MTKIEYVDLEKAVDDTGTTYITFKSENYFFVMSYFFMLGFSGIFNILFLINNFVLGQLIFQIKNEYVLILNIVCLILIVLFKSNFVIKVLRK